MSMQKAVLILGMHRSGTSCLTGSLQQKGLYLGTVFEGKVGDWNFYNQKGNRENFEIMQLNMAILAYNNGNWYKPPSKIEWNSEHANARDKIINGFLATKVPVYGFKDPRFLFTLSFWLDRLPVVDLIGSFRHPLNVADSLNKRNGISLSNSLRLWEKYNEVLYNLSESHNIPLVNFDVEQNEYLLRVDTIAQYLQLSQDGKKEESPFYDDGLISGRILENDNRMTRSASDLYTKLLNKYNKQVMSA